MESIIDAVKAMGKASSREIAARLDIDPVETLTMLREQREMGRCEFENGYWFIDEIQHAPVRKPAAERKAPAPVDPKSITLLLQLNGPMNTRDLADAVNRNSRGMVSVMHSLERQGVVVKDGKGEGVTWSLPGGAVSAPVEGPLTESAEKKEADFLKNIPVFVSRPDDLLIPTVSGLSREIRRTKAKLTGLERLRNAVREFNRNRHYLELGNE